MQTKFHLVNTVEHSQLAFLTLSFLGGISAEVCEISPHDSDFFIIFDE